MGIPCKHRLLQLIRDHQRLTTADFANHWLLDSRAPPAEPVPTLVHLVERAEADLEPHQHHILRDMISRIHERSVEVRDPLVLQGRGRPSNSNKRILSGLKLWRMRGPEPRGNIRVAGNLGIMPEVAEILSNYNNKLTGSERSDCLSINSHNNNQFIYFRYNPCAVRI